MNSLPDTAVDYGRGPRSVPTPGLALAAMMSRCRLPGRTLVSPGIMSARRRRTDFGGEIQPPGSVRRFRFGARTRAFDHREHTPPEVYSIAWEGGVIALEVCHECVPKWHFAFCVTR